MFDLFTNPKTPTTKDFIKSINNVELPAILKDVPLSKEYIEGGKLLIRLSFIGASAGDHLISSLVKKFDVDVNILYGNIDSIKDTPYGTLLVEISGVRSSIKAALTYLH